MQSPGGCESSVEVGLEKSRRTHESVSRGIYTMSTITDSKRNNDACCPGVVGSYRSRLRGTLMYEGKTVGFG